MSPPFADADSLRALSPRARRSVLAWCLYDFANSAFPTVIGTFVFPTYFVQAVAADETRGTSQWGVAMAVAGLLIALLSPPLGAIADGAGRRKPWLAAFTVLAVVTSAALWWVRPDPSFVPFALVVVVVASLGFELGTVFYNAMLVDVAPPRMRGRVSGWGWGIGYFGGLICLLACLVLLIEPDPPLLPLDRAAAEHVRATAVLVALWYALFCWPLFRFVPDTPRRAGIAQAVRSGLAAIARLLPELRRRPAVARFLLSRLLYTDGLNTLFNFGAIYAAGAFGMATDEIILLGIAMNVTAGFGAYAFAFIDDRIGPKRTVLISLASLAAIGVVLLLIRSKAWFWLLALPLGVFFGPAQAASRTLMSRLAPAAQASEYFGLFALSGRITAFAGPAALAWATDAFGSQRAGMATILVFLVGGGAILATVREPPPTTVPRPAVADQE
ncbi:MFS transporter [Elioraea thermophila]|uniref:MFS transporter n=1 Tax=Elioraea thermophila TaxID=2185104 RepID=UPI000DF3E819|nr:MFS transporter [Elioraea thermophila]